MPAISPFQNGLDVSRPDEMTAEEIEAYRSEYTGSNKGLLDSFEFWLEFRPDVLKRHKAAYFTHIRDEANKVLEGVEEAIAFARNCGVHVEIVHLKCSGVDNWGKAAQVLAMIEAARVEGCDIDCDAYPYAAGANPLKNLLPPWVQVGGLEAMLARLALPETRARVRTVRARLLVRIRKHDPAL